MLFYQVLALIIAVLAWAICYWTGNDTHTVDGIIFFGLLIVEGLLFWRGAKKP